MGKRVEERSHDAALRFIIGSGHSRNSQKCFSKVRLRACLRCSGADTPVEGYVFLPNSERMPLEVDGRSFSDRARGGFCVCVQHCGNVIRAPRPTVCLL